MFINILKLLCFVLFLDSKVGAKIFIMAATASHDERCMERINVLGPRSRQRSDTEPMASTLEVHPPTTPNTKILITDFLTMIETEILPSILELESAKFFMKPVDPASFPDYNAIVKFPMDLGTIRARLENLYYMRAEQFENDLQLIALNAMLYHDEGTEIYEAGRNLWLEYQAKQIVIPKNEVGTIITIVECCHDCGEKRGKRKSDVLETPEVTGKRVAFTKALNALTKKK
ncbi:unnamed protein product [Orchesella dallaii]|uniref:Bromo domain-containing protein n=1 Tax=Orchesella dallaii TaxID=48710 RepID=A0ABP1R9C7_9HEXA